MADLDRINTKSEQIKTSWRARPPSEKQSINNQKISIGAGVCTENLIRVDDVMESPKLAE
jgi:hypothetical protein